VNFLYDIVLFVAFVSIEGRICFSVDRWSKLAKNTCRSIERTINIGSQCQL
jgi:hypothetical protein